MTSIIENLKQLDLELPESAPPLFNYVPYVVAGNMVFIAGQVPIGCDNPEKYKGTLGRDMDMDRALEAAQQCGLNILRQIMDTVGGDCSKIQKCVKLGGFVNCTAEYTDMSLVINATSDLMVSALGEARGKHARFAVGAPSLPAGFCVEVDAIFEIS